LIRPKIVSKILIPLKYPKINFSDGLDRNTPSLTVAIQKVPPNNFEPIYAEDDSNNEITIPTFVGMVEGIQFNSLQIHQIEK
jgi:hypothetical protein